MQVISSYSALYSLTLLSDETKISHCYVKWGQLFYQHYTVHYLNFKKTHQRLKTCYLQAHKATLRDQLSELCHFRYWWFSCHLLHTITIKIHETISSTNLEIMFLLALVLLNSYSWSPALCSYFFHVLLNPEQNNIHYILQHKTLIIFKTSADKSSRQRDHSIKSMHS